MDIWDQVPLCAYRIDQIIQFTMYRLPLVRKDKRLFACSNEPCADRMMNGQREHAPGWTYIRLDAYGECRDSEQPEAANLSAWIIALTISHAQKRQHTADESTLTLGCQQD